MFPQASMRVRASGERRERRESGTDARSRGNHGYEYTSIVALQQLLPKLDPARMKGSWSLCHGLASRSTAGDLLRSDAKNLNGCIPASRTDESERSRMRSLRR